MDKRNPIEMINGIILYSIKRPNVFIELRAQELKMNMDEKSANYGRYIPTKYCIIRPEYGNKSNNYWVVDDFKKLERYSSSVKNSTEVIFAFLDYHKTHSNHIGIKLIPTPMVFKKDDEKYITETLLGG